MNYYPFHLGDYAAHTAHLTWEEDLAYRRLLDLYYLHEKPVQADVHKLARLVRMPKQIAAIEAVLAEFFVLRDDGWHNKRADDELSRMSEKAEATEERDKHEKTRMQRYRDRRSVMFEALRKTGVIPSFDISQKELQRLFDTHCNAAETSHERNGDVSGDAHATAIPTPTPTPTPKEDISSEPFRASEPVSSFAIPLVDRTEYQVTARELDEWRRAYPAVDVEQELREMRVWCMANPTKRKTRRGAPAFAVKWLAKAQDTPSHHRRAASQQATGDWTGGAL